MSAVPCSSSASSCNPGAQYPQPCFQGATNEHVMEHLHNALKHLDARLICNRWYYRRVGLRKSVLQLYVLLGSLACLLLLVAIVAYAVTGGGPPVTMEPLVVQTLWLLLFVVADILTEAHMQTLKLMEVVKCFKVWVLEGTGCIGPILSFRYACAVRVGTGCLMGEGGWRLWLRWLAVRQTTAGVCHAP